MQSNTHPHHPILFDVDVCDVLPDETAKEAFVRIQKLYYDVSLYEGKDRTIAGRSAETYRGLPGLSLWDATYFIHNRKIYILSSRVRNQNIYNRLHGSFQLLN